jgi:hypothetical protein
MHPRQDEDLAGAEEASKRAVEGVDEVAKWAVESDSHMVTVHNHGAYVAAFRVNYEIDGVENDDSSGRFSPGASKEVKIPSGGTDVKVDFYVMGILSQHDWVTSKEIEQNSGACFDMTGTALNPKVRECKDD